MYHECVDSSGLARVLYEAGRGIKKLFSSGTIPPAAPVVTLFLQHATLVTLDLPLKRLQLPPDLPPSSPSLHPCTCTTIHTSSRTISTCILGPT
jgi:hypothetical protein